MKFEQGHHRGSSHGGSRIIRRSYKQPHYARLMPAAFQAWKEIESETGKELMVRTSLVRVSARPPHACLDGVLATMLSLSLPHEVLDGPALNRRWPSLNYPAHAKAVVDPEAGIIHADVALETIQDLFVSGGGVLKWGVAVRSITPGNSISLETDSGTIVASSVVLCVGPWAPTLLAPLGLSLPLESHSTWVFYWPEKTPGAYSAPGHPNLIDMDTCDHEVFALPANEYPGLAKLCQMHGPQTDPNIANIPVDEDVQKLLSQYIRDYVPALEDTPSKVFSCFYTTTPDYDFILDKHPLHKNIIIGAGFSGTGFKLGPIVGHILSSLALDKTPPYDVTAFRLERFLQV